VVRRASPAAAVRPRPCGRPGRFEATGEISPAAWGHASQLVEDLLDIARIRGGKLQLESTVRSYGVQTWFPYPPTHRSIIRLY